MSTNRVHSDSLTVFPLSSLMYNNFNTVGECVKGIEQLRNLYPHAARRKLSVVSLNGRSTDTAIKTLGVIIDSSVSFEDV